MSDDKGLALLTTDDLDGPGEIYLADFKDIRALMFLETRHFLGLSKARGVRLGGHPLRLIDGVWYITEDIEVSKQITDLKVSIDLIGLELIK